MTARELNVVRKKLGLTWNELMEAIGEGADEVWAAVFGLAGMPEWLESIPAYAKKFRRAENHKPGSSGKSPVMIKETREVFTSVEELAERTGLKPYTIRYRIAGRRAVDGQTFIMPEYR